MLRATLPLLSAIRSIKASTGITGLPAHPDPLPALSHIYASTLSLLSSIPSTSVYRQATQAVTEHNLNIVEKAKGDVASVERELGMVEKLIEAAKEEQNLAGKMLEWKSWEALEEEPRPNQWRYFDPGNE
ncbi:NADH dehydrogenase (ubiquinone) 1 alpha subcomplex 5 [Tremella mesenterica]|uniref:NADH dehydrogenase (Ubiquinone) 1 alpha subcomplex 5 n=1 Tax=Tremella mesenterica TaxID=5217 RepID=A0A4Q1BPC1_TREME|nr:uncharacterized protein TREMEDRAFT_58534 [Tremella mesenterica DSM 1558]EIW72367.1 hypothetical protein TREMEDRAFT_58534 [Tremella mesenterica DSM 1558]RXK39731.1 NADH dehydrogenase (ubiquinone) 1 alpha subcomplex 5 [Tremella mesenterica]